MISHHHFDHTSGLPAVVAEDITIVTPAVNKAFLDQILTAPRTLAPKECIPQAGSVAQLGPAAGSMLLFELPLETIENRPLELEIEGEEGETLVYELDI